MAAGAVPNTPPPYGIYYITDSNTTNKIRNERELTVAKHYGYPDLMKAEGDCNKENSKRMANPKLGVRFNCIKDSLAHKRDSHPVAKIELKKYGFQTWADAVNACEAKLQSDMEHCVYDPFLKLRGK